MSCFRDGNNEVTGTGSADGQVGYGIRLFSDSSMVFGNGNNKVTASASGIQAAGIDLSRSSIEFGNGNNKVTGFASGIQAYGIRMSSDSSMVFGNGNNKVTASASDTFLAGGIAMSGSSSMVFGNGDDILTGVSISGVGIFVSAGSSIIDTGFGNDIVDAIGGFAGGGTVDLGGDND